MYLVWSVTKEFVIDSCKVKNYKMPTLTCIIDVETEYMKR
jgi:hypothetical protein